MRTMLVQHGNGATFLESPENPMSKKELEHHYRVIDMMLTAHSILCDRYSRRALITDLLLLSLSIVLCALVFADPDRFKSLNIGPKDAQNIIGACSVAIFLLSLVSLRVDWKQKAEKHGRSAEILSKLKSDCRVLLRLGDQAETQRIKEQCQACNLTLSSLSKIPENKFVRLKAAHKRKVELSKMIDNHPGSSVLLLRLHLWLRANFNLFRTQAAPDIKEEQPHE